MVDGFDREFLFFELLVDFIYQQSISCSLESNLVPRGAGGAQGRGREGGYLDKTMGGNPDISLKRT